MARFERGELPLTLNDAVRARLAVLPAHELTVMQWAAVVGELFWDGALLAIARFESARPAPQIDPILRWTQAQDELRLAEALEQLELKGFVVRLGDPVRPGLCEYTFPVAGTRSIVYAELPESSCRTRHAIVARWIRLATPLAKEGMAATLGLHLERAGQAAEAARAYLAASAEERARLRTTMALRYAQKALSLTAADETGGRIEALHEVGSLLATLGQYPQATAAFSEIVELAWKLGARGPAGAALNRLARIHRQRGEHGSALEYLHRALLLFRDAHDERGIASTYDDMAQVHRSLGDLEPALGAAEQALAARRSMQDARGESVSLTTIGLIELDRGRLALARQHFEAALDVRQRGEVSDPEGVLHTEIGLGRLEFHEGSPPRAIERFAVALERAREMNHRQLQSRLLLCLGEAQLALGAIERAQQLLLEARALAGSLRDQKALTEVELQLGLCALAHDDGSAPQKLTAALTLAREHGTRETIATAHRAVARVRARTLFDQERADASEDASAAESSFRESIRIFEESGNLREAARTRAELGYHLVERGAGERARAALGEAYAALKPLALPDLARVTETLEQL
jgi:tetratricopeptide (TPR) repeat protein